jgi:hypothetical protein
VQGGTPAAGLRMVVQHVIGWPYFVCISSYDPGGYNDPGIVGKEFDAVPSVDEAAKTEKLIGTKLRAMPECTNRFRLYGFRAL